MAALTEERNTEIKSRGPLVVVPVKAGAKILNGAWVGVDAGGFAVPAADVAGLVAVGRAEETVDNAGGADGGQVLRVSKGVFKYDNSPTAPVTQAQAMRPVFVEDDHTVAATSTAGVLAGICYELDPDGGVWIANLT